VLAITKLTYGTPPALTSYSLLVPDPSIVKFVVSKFLLMSTIPEAVLFKAYIFNFTLDSG